MLWAGCVCPSRKTFIDVAPTPETYDYPEKLWVDGKRLMIEVHQIPGCNVARIRPLILESGVYLDTLSVSSGGGGRARFELDMSRYDLAADWTNRIYWIESRSCPNLAMYLFTRGPHSEEISRRKATLN